MANAKNPFLNFDLEKALAGFEHLGIDLGALMAAQRKNIEALTTANQLTAEAWQAVGRRQAQLAQESAEEATALMQDIGKPGAPEELLAKQAEIAKTAFDKGVARTRELSDIVTQAQMAAFNVISKRLSESFTEFQAAAKTKPGKP